MLYRSIPQTTLQVSPLCLGTMTFGRPLAHRAAIGVVHAALDAGINFIDTADMYEGYDRKAGSAGGVAEQILGEALRDRRHEVVLMTKVGNAVGDESYSGSGLSSGHIRHQIEASLRRLETDYVDLYLLHRPDPTTPLSETLQTINELIKAGQIRYWGFSNFDAVQINEMINICIEQGWPRPVLSQPRYSWLDRNAEAEHMPSCQRHEIGVTPYQPLAGGLLTGKYQGKQVIPSTSRANDGSGWLNSPDESTQARLMTFLAEAKQRGERPVRYALQWLQDQPGIVAPVVGVRNLSQLQELVA